MGKALSGMRLEGVSAYAPEQVWSNARVAARLRLERMRVSARLREQGLAVLDPDEWQSFETSDRWVRRFIGFVERRFAHEGEGTIDLATRAARQLLDQSRTPPSEIDAILFASVTPSYLYSPPDAAMLQHALGIPLWRGAVPNQVMGADVSLACSSWMTALTLTYGLVRSGLARRVLLVGADRMSATINWRDRSFATVLGDAGTAMLCSAVPEDEDWFGTDNFWGWLDGSHAEMILTPAGGSRHPAPNAVELDAGRHRLAMDGAGVRQHIVPFMGGPGMDAALAHAGWTMDQIDLAVLHEANLVLNASILQTWRGRGFRGEVLSAGGRFGNTTSASIPLAIALNGAEFARDRRFALAGFGGGLSASIALGRVRHEFGAWTNAGTALPRTAP